MSYLAPKLLSKKFTCPHCGVLSLQRWDGRGWNFHEYGVTNEQSIIRIARCDHCEKHTLWLSDQMLYPDTGRAPQPNADLPESVKKIYLEAASISTKSPRGSAALLRLAIQVLCKELGETGNNINDDIGNLVAKGLPDRVQKALDVVRVTGNNAVHPGEIDCDDSDVVAKLFELLNVIAEYTLTMPQRIGQIYSSLPESARKQIESRDSKKA